LYIISCPSQSPSFSQLTSKQHQQNETKNNNYELIKYTVKFDVFLYSVAQPILSFCHTTN